MGVMPPIWRARPATPEQRLIAAILETAFRDMFAVSRQPRANGDTSPDPAQIDAAISFLTDTYGAKARWRNTLCSYLDLDGDVLAERIRMMLDGKLNVPNPADEPPSSPAASAQHSERVERARQRWLHLKYIRSPRSEMQL